MTHGGNIYKNTGMLDFSANISPFEYDFIKEAVISSAGMWRNYPDPDCTELVRRIGEYEKLSISNIVCGNGAADLIYRMVHALKPKKAVVLSPTFTEYEKALKEADCGIYRYHLSEENNFLPCDDLLDMIDESTDIIFVCSPNNPTGKVFPKNTLVKLINKCDETNTVIVCDECFMSFVLPEKRVKIQKHFTKNCICLKAFTKIFSVPGLRLGYALFGNEETALKMKNSGQCWSVSVPAQAAGIAALEHIDEIAEVPRYIADMRENIYSELNKLSIKYFRSDSNFILFRAEAGLDERMKERGILIRNCNDMISGYYRIAVRTEEENKRLITALKECVNG